MKEPNSHSKLMVEPDHESCDSVLFTMQYSNNKMLHKWNIKYCPYMHIWYDFSKCVDVQLGHGNGASGWNGGHWIQQLAGD